MMEEPTQNSETAQPERRKKMTRAEAGRKGGKKTRERYGNDFFREIGRIGGSKGSGGARRRERADEQAGGND